MNLRLIFKYHFVNKNEYTVTLEAKIALKGTDIMKVKNKSQSRIIRFLNGKAFYAVVCLCFLAIGVAAWSGIKGFENVRNSDGGIPTPSSAPSASVSENNESAQPTKPDKKPQSTDTSSEAAVSSDRGAEQTAAPIANFFVNPVLGEVMNNFSDSELTYSVTMHDMRLHKGVDLAADRGTPVVAAGEGTVTAVKHDPMLGSTVEIDHGNGITSRYCGLNSQPCVTVGQMVDTSTQLGTVDDVPFESVEQYHLHLEFYKDGKAVSPMNYISK